MVGAAKKETATGLILSNRFKLGALIGAGSFGEIYKAVTIATNETVAVKLEPANAKFPQLHYEVKLYRSLNSSGDAIGYPSVIWSGREGDYICLVMDLLGPSLEDLHGFCDRRFSLKTTMIIGAQMLNRLEYLHSLGFIHRDIKPDNFLMGTGKKAHVVYIIDFGLAKKYKDTRTNEHIPWRDGKSLTGTARYCSVHTHLGSEQSRRDDIEAIGYMLVYFLKGWLPWQGLKAANKQIRYDRISERKMVTTSQQLCSGIAVPEVEDFMKYAKHLAFEERPDYSYWHSAFLNVVKREGHKVDGIFDWVKE